MKIFFLSELSFFLSDFPQKSAFCQKSFHQKSSFYQNAAASVCQVSLGNLLFVRFPSKIFFFLSDFLQKSTFLSDFPQKSPSFLSDFPQKFSFCQVSFRKLLLSVSFPLEISFFLSEVRNIHLSVRFSSNISFFSVRYFLLSVKFPSEIFCQKSPFCQVSLEKSPDFLELK